MSEGVPKQCLKNSLALKTSVVKLFIIWWFRLLCFDRYMCAHYKLEISVIFPLSIECWQPVFFGYKAIEMPFGHCFSELCLCFSAHYPCNRCEWQRSEVWVTRLPSTQCRWGHSAWNIHSEGEGYRCWFWLKCRNWVFGVRWSLQRGLKWNHNQHQTAWCR